MLFRHHRRSVEYPGRDAQDPTSDNPIILLSVAETADMNSYESNRDTGNLPESSDRLLSVRELGRSFGGLRALDGVSFDVLSGQYATTRT